MRKQERKHYSIHDMTVNDEISGDTLFKIGGMGVTTINGPIREGAIIILFILFWLKLFFQKQRSFMYCIWVFRDLSYDSPSETITRFI